MTDLHEARIVDAVPNVIAKQPWVQALSLTFGGMLLRLLGYTDMSQAFTDLDNAQEAILDSLAVYLKVDWYDTAAPIEKKREYIKTALTIQKYAGTAYAVQMQASLIYPSSEVEEWFDYGGTPGRYRIVVNITSTPAQVYTNEEMEELLGYTKRCSAHIESVQYMPKYGLAIGRQTDAWICNSPVCGIPLCGTLWKPATLGWSDGGAVQVCPQAEAFAGSPDLTGTLPEISAKGCSEDGPLHAGAGVDGFASALAESGVLRCGASQINTVTEGG